MREGVSRRRPSPCTDTTRANTLPPPKKKQKLDFSADVKASFEALRAAGALPKWGAGTAALPTPRRNVFPGELRQMGVKAPDKIGVPSTRNDAAFLATSVLGFSALAVALGQLPGDWGFFGSYLSGAMILVVMGIGSTAPALLQVVIDRFSQVRGQWGVSEGLRGGFEGENACSVGASCG